MVVITWRLFKVGALCVYSEMKLVRGIQERINTCPKPSITLLLTNQRPRGLNPNRSSNVSKGGVCVKQSLHEGFCILAASGLSFLAQNETYPLNRIPLADIMHGPKEEEEEEALDCLGGRQR